MNLRGRWALAIAVSLGITSLVALKAHGVGTTSPSPRDGQAGYERNQGQWDAPQQGWNDIQRRGFRDGIDGAQKDYGNHRRPDVDNRDEYRHPNVPTEMWAPYREGFRNGYDRAMAHLVGRDDWRHQASDRPWDASPDGLSDIQRQGFRDGVEGARRDTDNHRRPDVNNRDEYRHPNVPSNLWGPYRDGFARGYQVAMSHLMGGAGFQPPPAPPWDAPDSAWNNYQRQGFQDGMDGARKDYGNHRQPDVNNRDEYRHPSVPGQARDAYREGFREGYNRAMSHLTGGHGGR
jgi:hypothetical protein